jgi:hypothetical protein
MFLGGWLPRVEQLLELQECRHLNPLGFLIVSQEHSLPNCAILRRMVKKRCDVRRERVGAQIYDRFRIWAQNAGDSPKQHGNEIAILLLGGLDSLEASTHEYMVSNSLPECPAPGTHSGSEFNRCRQR